jgi:hypothetical protein
MERDNNSMKENIEVLMNIINLELDLYMYVLEHSLFN